MTCLGTRRPGWKRTRGSRRDSQKSHAVWTRASQSLRVGVAVLTLVFSTAGSSIAGAAQSRTRSGFPGPSGLSQQGQMLWNLDALLASTFHSNYILAHNGAQDGLDFICAFNCPRVSGGYESYWLEFSARGGSQFRLSGIRVAGTPFGSAQLPVTIRGDGISCDTGPGGSEVYLTYQYRNSIGLYLACSPEE